MKDLIERLNRDIDAAEKARHEMIAKDIAGWPNAALFLIESASVARDRLTASEAAREKLEFENSRLKTVVNNAADQCDKWAKESRSGGWSTHQVDANIRFANDLRRALNTSEAHHG